MKRERVFRLILITVAFTLVMAACGMGANAQAELAGFTWELEAMGPRSNPYSAIPGHRPTLNFDFADGRVNGRAGCNSYAAQFKVNGERLSIGDAESTLMGCFPQEVMAQETEFLRILSGANSFMMEGGRLTIFSSGNEVLVFTQAK